MKEQKPIEVDYCKEAIDMHLSKLPARDIDLIVYNVARVVNGEINDINLIWNRIDEKTNKPYKIKVPVKSILKSEKIVKLLLSLGISGSKISNCLYSLENPNKKVDVSNKPLNLDEVKKFIYDTLKEKYGNAVISKVSDKDIIINTDAQFSGNDIKISLN